MAEITLVRSINAPIDMVFKTVADISNFSKAIPGIVKVEFLSEQESGVGTRFYETRLMKGKEASTELEVTEYVENEHVRIVSDTHGTVWDTIFTVEPAGESVKLEMTMDARAYKLMPKLMNPLVMKMISNAIESDMDSVKHYCETRG
jgi:carbon monoxide dehydrogenase subunit G